MDETEQHEEIHILLYIESALHSLLYYLPVILLLWMDGCDVAMEDSFHICLLRCGHKEAVFFQSHSMKAEVISAVYCFTDFIN